MTDASRDGRRRGWRDALRISVAATVGALLVRALGLTWRITFVNDAAPKARRAAREPFVYALWHGELLPLLWAHRGTGAAVVVSTHADGEIITRVLESLGLETVRGSSSRGGARALLEATALLKRGRQVALTPDGPRGPRRVFQPGAVIAAFRAEAPVIPVGAHVSRAWRLRSWDRLVIPKPFARITVRYADPAFVRATTLRDAEHEATRFQELLLSVSAPDEVA